ncbi:MAG: hypothetical protein ABI811_20940 [Acidobacteriota bacterium]
MRRALVAETPAEFAANLPVQLRALEQAAKVLRLAQPAPHCTELELLRNELGRVEALAHSADDFCHGWGRLLGMDGGYTPAGAPAELLTAGTAAQTRVRVQG